MSESTTKAAGDAAAKGTSGAAAAAKPPVYAHFFRLIGMPNFRFRLPSRNWSIFLTIVGSWTAAYMYDRREKKRIIQKWSDRVSHLSQQTLRPDQMPRSIRVVLSAPPADGLLTSREHFHEYVKPILVAGGMDWEAVEGRKEGDVRAMIAERIREVRIRAGEDGQVPERDETEEKKDIVREIRQRSGTEFEGGRAAVGGDLVIGRNTWKEYIRGLHEGWLGPLTQPVTPNIVDPNAGGSEKTADNKQSQLETDSELQSTNSEQNLVSSLTDIVDTAEETGTDTLLGDKTDEEKQKAEAEEEAKKKADKSKRKQPPAFVSTTDYADASIPRTISQALGPSITIPHPHILGFLNTPVRMWRFLRQRELANDIGKRVAAAVLASHQPYVQVESTEAQNAPGSQWEQSRLLKSEEPEWHKSVRKKAESDEEANKEHLWIDEMVLDSRIAGKMRKFVLPDTPAIESELS